MNATAGTTGYTLAALKHGLFDKDGVLQRMLSGPGATDGKT